MQEKIFTDGTHRTVSPQETYARIKPHFKKMGISRVANVTGLDRTGIPVAMAIRPNSRSISVSQGKGLDLHAAKTSAAMESIETWHAERITHALRFGSIDELRQIIPLADAANMARSSENAFATSSRVHWIEVDDLMAGHGGNNSNNSDNKKWVPLETISADYTLPMPVGSGFFAANTNGLASGNTYIEAVCHALYEVIERDAITMWKLKSAKDIRASGVLVDSIKDAACRSVIDKFHAADIRVTIWDQTSDVGIPTFTCMATGADDDWADPEYGSGSHPAREVALLRALTEAAQARTTFIAGSRDDFNSQMYNSRQRYQRKRNSDALLQRHEEARNFDDGATKVSRYLEDDLEWTLDRLTQVGVEQVLVVDLSNADFSIPVVKVVVPKLEGPDAEDQSDYVSGERALNSMASTRPAFL